MQNPTTIGIFHSRNEAEIARGLLMSVGIEANIAANDGGGTMPQLDFAQGVNVVVNAADAARARMTLEAPSSEV